MSSWGPVPAQPADESGVARDVAALGRLLGISAHPTDETYLSGGLMAAAADNGQPTGCITAASVERRTTSCSAGHHVDGHYHSRMSGATRRCT
jgi:LmbE family N-acetylglucosaminyl deacetylase